MYWSQNVFRHRIGAFESAPRYGPRDMFTELSDIQPHTVIRHNQLLVDAREPTGDPSRGMLWGVRHNDFTVGELYTKHLNLQLQPLLWLKERNNVCLNFTIQVDIRPSHGYGDYHIEDERRFVNVLEVLRRFFDKLKHAGNTVTIQLQTTPDLWESYLQAQTWDLTPRLRLSASD